MLFASGAGTKIRTRDLMITNQLLYQLSYTGGSYWDGVVYTGLAKPHHPVRDSIFLLHL